MECLVVMESKFKVEARKCPQLLAYIANTVFGQEWECEKEENADTHNEQPVTPAKKSRIEKRPLNFTLPSRKSIAKMVKSFSILSYQDMAMAIANARTKNQVVRTRHMMIR